MNFPKLYECDPQKNTECNKRNCGNPCKYTTRKEFSREPSEKMTPELAFMVLDVTRRERCEDTPRTRAACNVAQGALYLQMKASPYPDGDENVLACQNCKSGEYLYNEDGNRNEARKQLTSCADTGDTPSAWAKEAAEYCKRKGIFNGDGAGNFGWQQPITREAVACIIYRALEAAGALGNLSDV